MKRTLLLCLIAGELCAAEPAPRAFLVFDPPPHWECAESKGLFRCGPREAAAQRDAFLVFGMRKLPGGLETEDVGHGAVAGSKGNAVYSRTHWLNGQRWFDTLELDTQVAGYWTRELQTIARFDGESVLVFVSYVISSKKYAELAPVLDRLVRTLRLPQRMRNRPLSRNSDAAAAAREAVASSRRP